MRSLYITLVVTIVNFVSLAAYCQSKIQLSGWIEASIIDHYQSRELLIRAKESASKLDAGQLFKTEIDSNGKFNIEIPSEGPLTYLSFEMTKNTTPGKGRNRNITKAELGIGLSENYLFEEGDNINISFWGNGKIDFSGTGSEKLKCQWLVNNTPFLPNTGRERLTEILTVQKDFEKYLTMYQKALTQQINLRRLLLESYKDALKADIYKILYMDAISSAQYVAYSNLYNMISFDKMLETNNTEIKSCFDYISKIGYEGNDNTKSKIQSATYADMVIEKERVLSRFYTDNYEVNFAEILNSTNLHYQGELKRKILYRLCEEYIQKYYSDIQAAQSDILKNLKNSKYEQAFVKLIQEQSTAFPFEFWDVNDKPYKLEDFKGKVIVMDIWFTGCVPCTMLAKAMHPIFEKYQSNPNIVFITISTDQKPLWIESVKSGLYTSMGMLNLHTKGLAFAHPLIKYYKFNGAPRQIIINKKGQLITLSPPRVDVGPKNQKAFEMILETALSN